MAQPENLGSGHIDTRWNDILKVGGIASLIIVSLIPFQLFIFTVWPPPENALDFFALFQKNWFLGLLSLDLLYIISDALLILVYLGLFASLKHINLSYMIIAIVIGFIGIGAYFASSAAFEMLSLSRQYAIAVNEAQRQQFLAAGEAMLAIYKGTAFDVYYILNAITLLIISFVMLRDNTFSKATAISGLISGVLMTIPTTAGMIGAIFGIASLIPWIVFSVLIALRFFKISQNSAPCKIS